MFDHVCLMVNDMKGYISLFTEIFGFHIDKIVGEKENPEKLWFKECIQLNRTDSEIIKDGGIFNHLAISVDNLDEVIAKLKKLGGKETSAGFNWIMMPDGLYLEIL
ncbi:MAG: VOC family protein [Spirochaetales bacterium]|nr:VOC family protein [Spirochaetales bacterium]